jgi:two-component sensor histidine kinase
MLAAILQVKITALRTGPELIPREEVINALTEMVGKILAMARLHRILVAEPAQGELDLNNVLTEILHEFTTSGMFGDRLHLASTLGSGCLVDPSRAAVLAFVFSEILTNALKYAHPSGLPVELTIASAALPDGGMALEIADDGVGFPEGFDELRDSGVGLRLVRSLVENLGGRVETTSSELGLTFSIRLPPNPPAETGTPHAAAA